MNYYLYLIFLSILSIMSLLVFGLHKILDTLSVSTKQKIALLRVGLLMIGIAPIFYSLLRYFSWSSIEITLPGAFLGQVSSNADHAAYVRLPILWSYYIFAAYNIGFFVMLSRIIFSYLAAKRQLADSFPSKIHGYSVFLNKNIQSPLSFGLLVGKIYFPADAESRWTPREIQMSLAHENAHVNHRDSIWKLISLFVQAMLFFVPWSYILHKKLELEMEIYCDEKTCSETGADISEYGSLLLAMTCIQPQHLIFTNITDSTLKRRLVTMKSTTIKRPFLISIFIAVIIMTGSAAIAMASGITEKKTVFDILSKIYVDGKLTSSPRIIALANQKATIVMSDNMATKGNQIVTSGQSIRIEIIAKNASLSGPDDPISMSYDIQYQDGKEKMHSKPQIIVTPKQEGTINVESDSGHVFELRVLANRK